MEAASTKEFMGALKEAKSVLGESEIEHSLSVIQGLIELSKEIAHLQSSVDDIYRKIK